MARKTSRSSFISGIVSSIFASLCCLTPLVVVLLGLGGISVALSLLRYRPYFLILGFLFLGVATYVYLKRDYGKCNMTVLRKERTKVAFSFILMIGIYVVLTYFIIPPLLVSNVEKILPRPEVGNVSLSQVKLKISGLGCTCNVADIEYNLMQLKGVYNASIDYPTRTAIVKYDSTQISPNDIAKSKIFSSTYSAEII